MKKFWYIGCVFVLGIILAACNQLGTPGTSLTSNPAPSATPPPPQVVTGTLVPAETPLPTATEVTGAAPSLTPTEEPTTPPAEATATAVEPPASEPTVTATPATPPNSQASGSACDDKAAFYDDVTIPDDTSFKQSVEFVKTWRIRNEGTCTWNGYNLIWAGGNLLDAPLSNPIPLTQPGDLVDISVNMRSPGQGGVYLSQWEFQNAAGQRFGVNSGGVDLIWTRISVTWYPEGSSSPGVSTLPAPAAGCNLQTNPAYIDQLLGLINAERQKNGLAPLTLDSRLSAAAQAHSEDMACKNYMDHTGSDGSGWADRVKAAGYPYSYVSENIYAGDPAFGGDANGAFTWWMGSPVHRDNILSSKITQIGIGFAASDNAKYKGRYTLNFARP